MDGLHSFGILQGISLVREKYFLANTLLRVEEMRVCLSCCGMAKLDYGFSRRGEAENQVLATNSVWEALAQQQCSLSWSGMPLPYLVYPWPSPVSLSVTKGRRGSCGPVGQGAALCV